MKTLLISFVAFAVLASSAFAKPPKVKVYVGTPPAEFVSPELADSANDLRDKLNGDVLIVNSPDAADVVVTVIARGYAPSGSVTTTNDRFLGTLSSTSAPNMVALVRYTISVHGRQVAAFHGYFKHVAFGEWKDEAREAAKYVRKWLDTNRQAIAK